MRNVVIDHCSFSWSIDEIASTWGPTDNITFSNNIFAEPLHESIHPAYDGNGVQKHGFGVLLGPATGSSVTMVGNLFAHIVERNPLSRATEFVFTNNVTLHTDMNPNFYKGTVIEKDVERLLASRGVGQQ